MTDFDDAPPAFLADKGRQFWQTVTSMMDGFGPGDLVVLTNVCSTIDKMSALDDALVGAPTLVPASHGGMQVNPMISEWRQLSGLLQRGIKQLGLPDSEEMSAVRAGRASTKARAMAHARWGN